MGKAWLQWQYVCRGKQLHLSTVDEVYMGFESQRYNKRRKPQKSFTFFKICESPGLANGALQIAKLSDFFRRSVKVFSHLRRNIHVGALIFYWFISIFAVNRGDTLACSEKYLSKLGIISLAILYLCEEIAKKDCTRCKIMKQVSYILLVCLYLCIINHCKDG